MNKTAVWCIGAIVLFLAWRNGTAQRAARGMLEEAVPRDPYSGLTDQWNMLNSTCPNAHPSQNDVLSFGTDSFGQVGVC